MHSGKMGAVGAAKLYYADKTIQHAGVVIGLGAHRTAGHTHYRIPVQNLGYMGRLLYPECHGSDRSMSVAEKESV